MTNDELREALDRIAHRERDTRSTWVNRILRAIGPTRPFVALYRRLGPKIDPWLMRTTGGRIATHVYGFPALLLTSIGAKSGAKRTSPLLYARDGDDFLIVGTNFGTEHHPAWTKNLLKTSDAQIVVGDDTLDVRAEPVDEATFRRVWQRFTSVYPGYDAYLVRLTHRTPRMFRLRPIAR
jgi:deazaflavin-dependent oxidoreductase (nitroreductase family)